MTDKHSTTEETSKVETCAVTDLEERLPSRRNKHGVLRQAQRFCGVGVEHRKQGLSYGTLVVGLAGHRFHVI